MFSPHKSGHQNIESTYSGVSSAFLCISFFKDYTLSHNNTTETHLGFRRKRCVNILFDLDKTACWAEISHPSTYFTPEDSFKMTFADH